MQFIEIWRQILNLSNQVSARNESQYLLYNQRKSKWQKRGLNPQPYSF